MYNQNYLPINYYNNMRNNNDERFIGGFAFPFLLGGVTGAAIAPAFFGGYNNRPYCCANNYYYPPYYYQPYYRNY